MNNLAVSSVTGEEFLTLDLKKLLALAQVKFGVSNAQALSAIDALESTQLQLKVSPTGDIALTSVQLHQFTMFPKLPLELRMRIWERACFEPRIVEVEISTYLAVARALSADFDYTTRTPTPAVLHVCSEARQIGLKHYNRTFRRALFFNVKDPKEHIIYVDFEKDTIHLSLGQQRVEIQNINPLRLGLVEQSVLYPETLRCIERIALPMPPQSDRDVYQYEHMLRLCTGLTEAIIVCDQDESGFVLKQEASRNQYSSGRKRLRFSEPPSGEKTRCEEFVRDIRCRLEREQELVATNERLPPLITCKRLERI